MRSFEGARIAEDLQQRINGIKRRNNKNIFYFYWTYSRLYSKIRKESKRIA